MDNEVIINVVSRNGVKPGFDSARADAHRLATDIEGDFKKAGPRAGKALSDGIGAGVNDSGSGVGEKITRGVEGRLRDSRGRFVGAGKGIGESIGLGAGDSAGKQMSTGILDKLKGLKPGGMQALIEIGVAASPFLGAVISGAIIGGAGIGGVLGGVAVAAQDPGVQRAFNKLGHNIGAALRIDAQPMVKPVIGAIQTIQDSFTRLNPIIENIFSKSADFIAPLTAGITGMVEGIADGINNLVNNAGPTIDAFGELFSSLGESVGSALTTISGDSSDATDAIQDLSSILNVLVESIGFTIRGLTEMYGAFNDAGAAIVDMERSIGNLPDEQSELGTFMRHTAAAARDQVGAFKELADQMQAQTDPLFALIKGQRDVAKAQSHYNDVLKKHKKNSAEAKDAMADLGEKAFALQGKIAAAAGGFNGRLTPAMRTALKNAGLTAGQIGRLEKQLRSASDAANAWSGTFRQTYITSFKTFGKPYSQDGIDRGDVGGLASGGISGSANGASPSGLTWVGENGPELLKLSPGSRVYSNSDSKRPGGPGRPMPGPGSHRYDRPELGAPGSPMHGPDLIRPGLTGEPGTPWGRNPRNPLPRFYHQPVNRGGGGSGGGGSSGGGGGSNGDPFIVNLVLDGKVLVSALVDPTRNFVRTAFGGSVQKAYGVGTG